MDENDDLGIRIHFDYDEESHAKRCVEIVKELWDDDPWMEDGASIKDEYGYHRSGRFRDFYPEVY